MCYVVIVPFICIWHRQLDSVARLIDVAQASNVRKAYPWMSDRLAPFVHGCATLLLKEGFVANTQDHTSHSLGPKGPIEALDESVPTEFVREIERERERVDET